MTEDNQERGNPAPIGASDGFFEALEDSVNGAIQDNYDNTAEVTQAQHSGPEQVTHTQTEQGTEGNIDWEKRYKDSTREAQRLNAELRTLKPYVPVLNAMKKDTGLVEHVKDYFQSGGAPSKSLKERLGLGEDFEFNPQDLEDPGSDSSKLLNAQVDTQVQQRLSTVLAKERQGMQKAQSNIRRKKDEEEFRKKHSMSSEDFRRMMGQAQRHKITLDDVYTLLNKDKVQKNVASNAKADMLTQMKNVRNIPTSASGTNSAQVDSSPDDNVFDSIVGSDGDIDNLFG